MLDVVSNECRPRVGLNVLVMRWGHDDIAFYVVLVQLPPVGSFKKWERASLSP
jgi:hypothetical protein